MRLFQHTEDSDGRPCSEIDFYNGPMTRHKQQLLQEQEMLLEQVQKNHLERNGSKDINNAKAYSSESSSPTNSSVTSTTPNSINESLFQTASLERRPDNEGTIIYAGKSQSFKTYKERQNRKAFVSSSNENKKFEDSLIKENQHYDEYVFGLPQVKFYFSLLFVTIVLTEINRLYLALALNHHLFTTCI